MLVKICGLNPLKDVQICLDYKVNFLGFVFYKNSPRNLDFKELDILKSYNKGNSSFVAVTVDPSDEFIDQIKNKNFDYIQLHGSESFDRIEAIKKRSNLKIIKVIKVNSKADVNKYQKYKNADIFLFDTPGMEKSIEFPRELIKELPKGNKFALAGGVSIDTVKYLAKLGVKFFDLSSSLESDLGYKDHKKIKDFMEKLNDQN